jgi:hypothetical protein
MSRCEDELKPLLLLVLKNHFGDFVLKNHFGDTSFGDTARPSVIQVVMNMLKIAFVEPSNDPYAK